MITAEAFAAVLVLAVPIAQLAGRRTTAHVLLAARAIGTAFYWFDAAAWGAFTRVGGRESLAQANSLIWAAAAVAGIAAPAAARVFAGRWHVHGKVVAVLDDDTGRSRRRLRRQRQTFAPRRALAAACAALYNRLEDAQMV